LVAPNAEELVEKYTALAETAWISKLAQAILGIHFGWNNGCDETGRKRVRIVSGGLTGKIRRKYGLNRILNPKAKDEEEAEKKNRDDDRHHALDAMVISFLPNWARNERKTAFFKFPDAITPDFFAREIADVVPVYLCFEKPRLAETIYGARNNGNKTVIVTRAEVRTLAQKPVGVNKTKFDLEYAQKQFQRIRDEAIRKRLKAFLTQGVTESEWNEYCDRFCVTRKDGANASLVRYVTMDAGEITEFKDLSKDGTGAFRKALKGHKGQFVFIDKKGKARVRPVYAFESLFLVRRDLESKDITLQGFFRTGCMVKIDKAVDHPTTPLEPGAYKLNTILADGRARLTGPSGTLSLPISLDRLLAAGFRRA
jgi:CRISPR-associated endonuclease Csn1